MLCVIKYHLHDLKNVKNTHGELVLLVKLQAVGSTNGTKSRKAPPHISYTELRLWTLLKHVFSFTRLCNSCSSTKDSIRGSDTSVLKPHKSKRFS